jgi:hypothetical protein
MSVKTKIVNKRNSLIVWLPVFAMILLAIYCRFRFNFFQSTINGDGAYFSVQIRSVLNHFRLALPDMPLYFYFSAFITKILIWLHISVPGKAIILTIKLIDVIIPPLSAICVFLLAKKFDTNENGMKFTDYLMTGFSILFFPFMGYLNGELQKDAIGVMLIFLCLLNLYTFFTQNKKWPVNIFIILVLAVFIDFSTFVLMSFFIGLFALFYFHVIKEKLKAINTKTLLIVTGLLILIILSISLADIQRAKRLLSFPFAIFDNPVIAFWINGDQPFDSKTNLYIGLINLLSLVALILITVHRKSLERVKKCFAYSLCVAGLILASPLLNIELAWRLYIMSFIPVTIVYLIIYKLQLAKVTRGILLFLFPFMLIMSLQTGLMGHKKPQMSKEAFAELHSMKDKVTIQANSITVTKLFVGWWYTWELNTKVCQDYALTNEDLKRYSAIYFLKQTNGYISSRNNVLSYEVSVPDSSSLIYKGENFELYQLNKNFVLKEMPHVAPIIAGEVQNINDHQFTINDAGLNYFIEYNSIENNLENGTYVKIWGDRKLFSTKVKAATIIQL